MTDDDPASEAMTPQLCKLAHVELVTPDLDRSLWFFTELLGLHEVERDGERVYLRCFTELDHHSLALREGPAGVDHIAFRTAAPEHVDAFADRLATSGVELRRVAGGEEAGQGEAIRFVAPHLGAPLELFHDIERSAPRAELRSRLPTNSARFTGCAPRRIDHVHLATALDDVTPSEAWLRERLGFKRREYVRSSDDRVSASWLSVTPLVHDLAITPDRQGRVGRLNHIAFTMEDYADITRLADVVAEYDVHVDLPPGRHGVTQGHFYYVRDPGSGHRVELASGGYLIFDPDWEPIEWSEADFSAHGLKFVGPGTYTRENNPNAETTPC